MYYIRPLLNDSVTVTLPFSHGFSTKCIDYYTNCIDAVTVKILKIRTPQKFAVIMLKFEQAGSTKE